MSDITYEHIKAIAKLENDVKERDATIKQLKGDIDHNVKRALEIAEEKDATIKQLKEENQRLKEALKHLLHNGALMRMVADNKYSLLSESYENARKLIEP